MNVFQLLALNASSADPALPALLDKLHQVGAQDLPDNSNDRRRALHYAAQHGRAQGLRAFLSAFPDDLEAMTTRGLRPLHMATLPLVGELDIAVQKTKLLLDAGADPRPRGNPPRSPLNYAVEWSTPDTVCLLLDTGVYSDDEVEAAIRLSKSKTMKSTARIFHDAFKAKRVIESVDDVMGLKLL